MATKRMTVQDLQGTSQTVIGGRVFASQFAVRNMHGKFNNAPMAEKIIEKNEQCIYDPERVAAVNRGGRKVVPTARAGRIGSRKGR